MRVALRALLLALVLGLSALGALAQTEIDYTQWNETATRAEDVLAKGDASDVALEILRAQLVDFRDSFVTARSDNAARIETLQKQIEALGPAPAEGATEAADIAKLRADLTTQLATLQAPVVKADEAYNRAIGLIAEIDATIRTRQTDKLLTLGPSPLNPSFWPAAVTALYEAPMSLWTELMANWASDAKRAEARQNLLVTIILLVIGIAFFWRGPRVVMRTADWLRRRTRSGQGVWAFLVQVGLIVVPNLGLICISAGLIATGLAGYRGEAFLKLVPSMGLTMLFARWLSLQAVRQKGGAGDGLMLNDAHRQEAHRYGVALGILVALRELALAVKDMQGLQAGPEAVLLYPFLLLSGLTLVRFAQILGRAGETLGAEAADPPFRLGVVRMLARLAMAAGILGPLLGAVGYLDLASSFTYPTLLTLALLGLLLVLQRFVRDVWRMVTRQTEEEADGLLPVLMGFSLALAAMPVLALIWGVRLSQLADLWTNFRAGYVIGQTRISPTDFLIFAVVFVLGYGLTRLVQGALRSSVLPKTRIDTGGQTAIVSGLGYLGIMLSALVAITSAGIDLTALGYVAGALSVGIGFGLQNIVSNFVSGIILLIERPVSEGDWIEVGGKMGYVRDISVRSTRIETFDRTDLIVPNADLITGTVTNYTRGNTVGRVIVPVGVAYGTDTKRVEGILREIAEDHPMVLMNPPPGIIFQGFGADSLNFEIRAILRDVNWSLAVKSDMNHQIAARFAREGIEIPFAQRDIWIRNPETLTGGVRPAPPPEPTRELSETLIEPEAGAVPPDPKGEEEP